MTISSALNAGVSGLSANASSLAAISDNIANSSTSGYKRVQTDFQSMVIGTSGGRYTAGGVSASNMRLIDQRGPLVGTNNATDLAVSGRGMLPVASLTEVQGNNGSPTMMMTTTGSFRTNEEGYLTTNSGLVLLGWPANPDGTVSDGPRDTAEGLEPVQYNMNQLTGEPTTAVGLGVNLPATDTEAGSAGTVRNMTVEYYDNLGSSQTLGISYTPTVPATGSSNEWTMQITDSASGGAVIGEYTVTFNDSRTAGGSLASVTAISGGAYDPTTGSVVVSVDGGPVEISVGMIGESEGLTQLSDTFAPATVTKDGSEVGTMVGVEVDPQGYVRANYDSGASRVIYKIPLVDVPNLNGLKSMDNQTYLPSSDSGSYFLWDAGDGPTGDIASNAREESATDVATELTDMIKTQRAYSSNAKVIQTVDEMLQETTNIKR
ncbi:flagellar hook protein FlgE [Pseudophaeobacter flagellatus]|uniref:flagellar hook protein FlgE n=1 Tax=Pseudophaeobacter flagellatus TaxID=2899119 RepID=UPI001E4DF071|nr:flagellar hook-basal body complex protein [Pseudophaeobacter flagellatus]MCD9147098.1 flagellar hook-basal body complex protein [Pseudophaeobacter flagellatus]